MNGGGGRATDRPSQGRADPMQQHSRSNSRTAAEWIVVVYHSRNDRRPFVAPSSSARRSLSISSYTHSIAWRSGCPLAPCLPPSLPRAALTHPLNVSHPTRRITPLPSFHPLFGHVCVDVPREGVGKRAWFRVKQAIIPERKKMSSLSPPPQPNFQSIVVAAAAAVT